MKAKLSEEDRILVENLREEVKDELTPYYDTDFNLLRWLQGHDYDFDVVVPKLRNHLRFRRSKWNLDEIAGKPRNHPIHSRWKSGVTGPAERTPNAIVNIEQTGCNDYWGMLQTYPVNEVLKARLHDLETMQKAVMDMEEITGEQASVLYFMDLNNVKYDKRLLSLITGPLAAISSFMSEHYIELIHTFVLVHAPSFITTIWTIARPLLPEKTRHKVKIFGSNWRQEVLKIAVPESLPTFWNEPGSNIFKAALERAMPFDPELYYQKGHTNLMHSLTVPAGKTGLISIKAEKGDILRWKFTADGNFGFAVYFTEDNAEKGAENMKDVYPYFSRIPGPSTVPVEDEIACEESGYYKLWFSNEHAWIHTLKVHYNLETNSPTERIN